MMHNALIIFSVDSIRYKLTLRPGNSLPWPPAQLLMRMLKMMIAEKIMTQLGTGLMWLVVRK